jgi:hypothetical protein
MKKLNRLDIKEKIKKERKRCFKSMNLSNGKSGIFDEIMERLDVIKKMRDELPRDEKCHIFDTMVKYHKGPSSSLEFQILKEISHKAGISKEIYDEKIRLVKFICKSLNCKKGQVTFGASFSSFSVFDTKEYMKRDIIVHLGDLTNSFTINEIGNRIIFPKYVTGDFKIYLPASIDYNKLFYPEYIFGEDIEIMLTNKKFFSE